MGTFSRGPPKDLESILPVLVALMMSGCPGTIGMAA